MSRPIPGQYDTVGHCAAPGCGKPMLSTYAWRIGIRKPGHVSKGAGDLCRKHHMRFKRNGTTERQVPRPSKRRGRESRSREEILEEYAMIRDSVATVREAADRMGLSFSALDKALYRARKEGLAEAALPRQQLERAIAAGHHHLRSDAA